MGIEPTGDARASQRVLKTQGDTSTPFDPKFTSSMHYTLDILQIKVGAYMSERYYTIGVAGHIDHGKTALTKALTNIDTDRLKEEKERSITIELGYAPFALGAFRTTIIDVPGHEKFIRKMIAGVAGIDLVLLVIAADEGVMPQTKEHMEILSFLKIRHGLIVVTKRDRVEDDFLALITEQIEAEVKGTLFEQAGLVYVDSLSGRGIAELKSAIEAKLAPLEPRSGQGLFRMPIDQTFTLQGHGTIVRGTIYEGTVKQGDTLTLLPGNVPVKVKQLQVHGAAAGMAGAGQRAAINVSGAGKGEIARGHVLVAAAGYPPMTSVVDVSLQTVKRLQLPVKQRAPVKFYAGTAEVTGRLVLFDRNELRQQERLLCQIRLDEPVCVRRGDRFVLRRPSPAETVGGGWIIDPYGEKYRFGPDTIAMLERKREGTPEERIMDALQTAPAMSFGELAQAVALPEESLTPWLASLQEAGLILKLEPDAYASAAKCDEARQAVCSRLRQYHEHHPMRAGMSKAECMQELLSRYPKPMLEAVINQASASGELTRHKHELALAGFRPRFPDEWKTRLERAMERLALDRLSVSPWTDYLRRENVPERLHQEVKHLVLAQQWAMPLDDQLLIHSETYSLLVQKLYEATQGSDFTIQDAKEALQLSRKPLLLFLELLDRRKVTRRAGDHRQWV